MTKNKKERTLNRRVLKQLLTKWVKILKLSPPKWKEITIDFGSEDRDTDTPIGYCIWSYEEQTAQIYITSAKFYEAAYGTPLTIKIAEQIVIHELLHLTLLTGTAENHMAFEQGLNILSDVLWEAYGEDA